MTSRSPPNADLGRKRNFQFVKYSSQKKKSKTKNVCRIKDNHMASKFQLSFKKKKQRKLTFVLVEVVLTTPIGFSGMAVKRRRVAPPFFAYLFIHQFCTLPENSSPRSPQVRSPGQVKWTYLKKYLGFCRDYSFWVINMKLSGVYKGICTYKTHISEFWLQWPEVRSISWPHHYKARGKCWYAGYSKSTGGNVLFISRYSYNWPFLMTRVQFWPNDLSFESFEVRWGHIRFLPLTFDRIEIERWGWSQCVSLAQTHRLICNMTYLARHVTKTKMFVVSRGIEWHQNFNFFSKNKGT